TGVSVCAMRVAQYRSRVSSARLEYYQHIRWMKYPRVVCSMIIAFPVLQATKCWCAHH
ncbi:unnamed protein product, partial [Ceratitis capitata]